MCQITDAWGDEERALWELFVRRVGRFPEDVPFAQVMNRPVYRTLSDGEQYVMRVLWDTDGLVLDFHEAIVRCVDDEYAEACRAVLASRRQRMEAKFHAATSARPLLWRA